MISVRRNVFETNSSSSHSFVIRTDDCVKNTDIYYTHEEMLEELRLNKQGNYKAYGEWDFGRAPFRPLFTFEDKFRYAWASFQYQPEKQTKLIEIVQDLVPEFKGFVPPTYCALDNDMLDYWLDSNGVTLKEFLTNKKYVVIQDGDEYNIWRDMIRVGLIDTKHIENKEGWYVGDEFLPED